MTDVVVVGGGIVGTAVAAACARSGARTRLVERGALAGGASALDLALLRASVDIAPYLELHHFTGGAFFLDRSPPDDWPARRIGARAVAAAFAAEARSYGAEIHIGCDAKALAVRSDRVRAVVTDEGMFPADAVVLAAGTESWRLCAPHGVRVPFRAELGELIMVEPPSDEHERPALGDGAWIAQDEAGLLHVAHPDRAEALLPGLSKLAVLSRRTLRTADGTAGPVEEIGGLFVASAAADRGVELAPAIAASVAEWVSHV